jgi:hypothetical protein
MSQTPQTNETVTCPNFTTVVNKIVQENSEHGSFKEIEPYESVTSTSTIFMDLKVQMHENKLRVEHRRDNGVPDPLVEFTTNEYGSLTPIRMIGSMMDSTDSIEIKNFVESLWCDKLKIQHL